MYGQSILDTIPNGNFEYWQYYPNANQSIPDPWGNGFKYNIWGLGYYPPNNPIKPYKDSSMVYLNSGSIEKNNFIEQGFQINSTPKSLYAATGYYYGMTNERFSVELVLLNSKNDTIAHEIVESDPKIFAILDKKASPHDFVFPIKYINNSKPTFCYIRFNQWTNSNPSNRYNQTMLFIDDVKFLDTLMENGVWHPDTNTHNDTTKVDTTKHTSINYYIAQNPLQINVWPNPSSGDVTFSFRATGSGMHVLYIYDITGRLVATPIKQALQNGKDILAKWDCPNCNSGVYNYILQSPSGVQSGKMMLVK